MRELVRIAAPSVAATTSYVFMQFVDKWMVSHIGPDPVYVGAQGSGGLAAWIPVSIVYGTLGIINTFVAQNLGAGKPERGPAYAWNAMWLGLMGWVLLIPYALCLPLIFRTMGYDDQRVELATQYGQIMVLGSIVTMSTRGMSQYFYGMQRPKVVMMASLTGNIVNLFFNWVLVLGNLGAPAMGVRGSAIATLIGTSVEGLLPLLIFLGPAMNATLKTRSQWHPRRHLMKEILSLGWPAGAMFGSEMICWGFFMLYLVGSQGKEAGTAGFITQQWMSLSFMPTVGISFAISSTVGKYMGMKRPDLAALRAVVGFKLAIGYMTLCGVGFLLFRTQLINFFMPGDTPPDARAKVLELGGKFLIAAAAFQFFDGMAMSISGALRGAGDTKYLGVATVVLSWAIMVGGGMAIVRWVPQLGAVGPWVAAALYIVALALVSLHRYWGGAWRKLTVVDP